MKTDINLTEAEERLAQILWQESPIHSPELVLLASQLLGWKKSTTYTILKKLCDKGVFKNENAKVTALLTSDELLARQSRRYVEDSFGGSLPRFIASFIGGGKKLTQTEASELKQLIAEFESEGGNE
ncbi:MAG: BlaI/MecI/CopY family transcriptional regulator [Defluviitaleaceae bacterium]|nr:BlaI/MecI/CopY family transcriptional regulator [Defluviitaleaceae bacterium]